MFPRKSPKEAGFDEAIISELVDDLEKNNVHSYVIVHDGSVVSEGFWSPYGPDYTHTMYSVTKSFTSTAIGIAIDEGLLTVDDYVLPFFEGELPSKPCENMQKVKVKHLLTMSTGHTEEPKLGWSVNEFLEENRGLEIDHIQRFLTSYIPLEPGTHFLYNTPATYMLGAILHKLTGKNILDYLKPRLLGPLGITNIAAEEDSKGLNGAGFGFQATTEDLAKFGWLLLKKGNWNGKQLVSEKWVDEATAKQIDSSIGQEKEQWAAGYCYQYWRCSDGKSFRADGLWGQFSIVYPQYNTVVAITSASTTTQEIVNAVQFALEKNFGDNKSKVLLNGNGNSNGHLSLEKLNLKDLHRPLAEGKPLDSYHITSKVQYRLAENMVGISSIAIDLQAKKFEVWKKDRHAVITIGEGKWVETKVGEDLLGLANYFGEVACSGAVDEGDEIVLKVVHVRSPFTDTFRLKFTETYVSGTFNRDPFNSKADCDIIGLRL